jgi:hypothetical protein
MLGSKIFFVFPTIFITYTSLDQWQGHKLRGHSLISFQIRLKNNKTDFELSFNNVHHKLFIPQFGNGNCVKSFFHGFICFAHKCHAFETHRMLKMDDAHISRMKYFHPCVGITNTVFKQAYRQTLIPHPPPTCISHIFFIFCLFWAI